MSVSAPPPTAPRPPPPPGPYLVAGVGRAGRALIDRLRERGESVVAWDGLVFEYAESVIADLRHAGVEAFGGGEGTALLDRSPPPRCLVKSPGIPFDHPLVAKARARGLPVLHELELAWMMRELPIVAVTGTNGKSTVAGLLSTVLAAAGIEAPVAGNTQFGPPLSGVPGEAQAAVGEVSSAHLEGCSSFLPELGVLLNVTQDHLYRHGSMETYTALKRSMFVRGERNVPAAALNADDPIAASLAAELRARGASVATFGFAGGASFRVDACESSIAAARVAIAAPGRRFELTTRLPGPHNASNVAAALAAATLWGVEGGLAAEVVEVFPGVPGRFERVDAGQEFDVVVDFAHNPDGLERALGTMARIVAERDGRLIAALSVPSFCDVAMCRAMGAVAAGICDRLVLTTERLAPDDPLVPVPGLAEGAASRSAAADVVPERREAIAAALELARPGDVVAVLGRGERAAPLCDLAGRRVDYRDADAVRDLLGVSAAASGRGAVA